MKSSVAIFYKALSMIPAAMLVLLCVFPSTSFARAAAAKPLDPSISTNSPGGHAQRKT